MPFVPLLDNALESAAGLPVDVSAYEKYEQSESGMNLARLQRLGRIFRHGCLTDYMRQACPVTARCHDDYLMMADLFIHTPTQAQAVLHSISADLTACASAADCLERPEYCPAELHLHVHLYRQLAKLLGQKFNFAPPPAYGQAPQTKVAALQQPFVQAFIARHQSDQQLAREWAKW